nr:DeoR/GlpR family DNA-binding transcription regulator [Paenibacillus shirakamiensis]
MKILDYLQQHESMSVGEICSKFEVSRDTARRDIVKLVQEGVVVRTHGGVALPELQKVLSSYQDRLIEGSSSKNHIGQLAAKLIHDHETVFFDVSTTVQFVAEHIQARQITAVTHSIDNAGVLSKREDLSIYVLGGYLHTQNRLLYGPSVLDKISEIKADKAYIGATSVQSDGLYYPYEEDVRVKKEMAKQSDQVILVADHSKFSAKSRFKLDIDYVDIIVTDQSISEEMKEVLDRKNITLFECTTNNAQDGVE